MTAFTVIEFAGRRRDDEPQAAAEASRRSSPAFATSLPVDLPCGPLGEEFAESARASARADRYRAHQEELRRRKEVRLLVEKEHQSELANARRTSYERGERDAFSKGMWWGAVVGAIVSGYAVMALVYAGKWIGSL